jgi:hypothetical protein
MELLSQIRLLMDGFGNGLAMAWLGGRKHQAAHNFPDDESELLSRQLHCELEGSLRLFTTILRPGGQQRSVVGEPITQTVKLQRKLEQVKQCRNKFGLLPPELLSQILSYVVAVPGNIHVYAPHGNSKHGWRLSLCPESSFDPAWGSCNCRSGRATATGTATDYMDTALLLVSRAMRQMTFDIMFSRNHFVFTDIHDLRDFASELPAAAARIQSLRLHHMVDDSSCWPFQARHMASTRLLLKSLRHLQLRVLLSTTSSYESIYEDGFLNELCHFGKPLIEDFGCSVHWRGQARYWRSLGLDEGIPRRVQEKLIKIFTGVYGDNIPFSKPPPEKIQEADRPLSNKKGIVAWAGC